MSEIRAGQVAKYMLLPSIVPRFRELFGSGFGQIAYFVALLYKSIGLLPVNHPYTISSNIGRFGIFHVVAEAANRLEFRRDKVDQIIMFSIIMIGLAILAFQVFALLMAFFVPAASAQTIFTETRTTAEVANDISFILLDRIFGVPNVFNSCISVAEDCTKLGLTGLNAAGDPAGADTAAKIAASSSGQDYVYYGVAYDITQDILPKPVVFPTPFHVALHGLFRLYSIALLVIAMIIFLYLVVSVVLETAQTGTPFGRRFNSVWAPIRLVFAIGLLVPVFSTGSTSSGLNAAQYLVLYAAKYGSIFATNGWKQFTTDIETVAGTNGTILGDRENLISIPKGPDIRHLVEFHMLAKTCYYMHMCDQNLLNVQVSDGSGGFQPLNYCPWNANTLNTFRNGTGATDPVRNPTAAYPNSCPYYPGGGADYKTATLAAGGYDEMCGVQPYLVRSDSDVDASIMPFLHTPYDDTDDAVEDSAMEFFNGGDVLIRYGIRDTTQSDGETGNAEFEGYVAPTCGEIVLRTSDLTEPGAKWLRTRYYDLLREMWYDAPQYTVANDTTSTTTVSSLDFYAKAYVFNHYFANNDVPKVPEVTDAWQELIYKRWYNEYKVAGSDAQQVQVDTGYFTIPQILVNRGWAGAGIWYNRLAEMNGSLVTSSRMTGEISKLPAAMVEVRSKRAQSEEDVAYADRFNPESSKDTLKLSDRDHKIATVLYKVIQVWHKDGITEELAPKKTNNIVVDTIATLFGITGLFDMRENANIHPLAQLVAVGKGLVDSAILFMGGAILGFFPDESVAKLAGVATSIATIGLTAGFILYYVLPFLPFLYFFFAVGGWVKAIFEAMVGVPLWALAHLRIDGDGLPGEAALSGYMLIFEIFLRPIMILFGLLASVTIFAAMVYVLNDIFELVVSNLTGYDQEDITANVVERDTSGNIVIRQRDASDPDDAAALLDMASIRGPVDQFFFTVIYAIIVYMIGMSCFKLVDLIPNQILRWMGQSVSAFGEGQTDAAGQLTQYAAFGGMNVVGQLGGAVDKAGGAARGIAAGIQKSNQPPTPTQ